MDDQYYRELLNEFSINPLKLYHDQQLVRSRGAAHLCKIFHDAFSMAPITIDSIKRFNISHRNAYKIYKGLNAKELNKINKINDIRRHLGEGRSLTYTRRKCHVRHEVVRAVKMAMEAEASQQSDMTNSLIVNIILLLISNNITL